LIADDLIADKEEANSATIREGAWDWWNTVFYTRKQQHSGIILVETRWHLDDPAGKIEEQEAQNVAVGIPESKYDHWDKMTFPAIADQDEKVDGKHFRFAGEALCPERFSLENLLKTKNAYLSTGKIGDWAALYQQQPIIAENAEFRREWFKYYTPEDLKLLRGYYLAFVDLAVSQKKTADNVVVRTMFFEYDRPNVYLVDETAGRIDPLKTIDAMFYHWSQYRPKFYIESVGYQAALQYFLVEEMRRRKEFFQVEELKVKTRTSKEERIRGLISPYKAGCVFHRKDGSDSAYETELLQFPKGVHDDRIDAVSMYLQVARHTPKHLDEEQIPGIVRRKTEQKKDFDPTKSFQPV
jgi:predicted phage terminase large subunit-like protein